MKILFICTGNIFRSMSAEYCLKKYLEENNISGFHVGSAGTQAKFQEMRPKTYETLMSFGIDPSEHIQKKISQEMINNNDIIIGMSDDHLEYIKQHFGIDIPLFNEVAFGKKEELIDVNFAVEDWLGNVKEADNYIKEMVIYIHDAIPELYKNLEKFS